MRTPEQWQEYCRKYITAGYTPGGDKAKVYQTSKEMAVALYNHLHWKPGDVLLDVGSGNGRLAFGLLGAGVKYHGLEIIKPCVDFCKQAFAPYTNFRFYHLDLKNKHYWAIGTKEPESAVYPLPDASVDYVVAHSLYSHTGTIAAAKRNLDEMYRVMKPGALMCSTWFLCPPKPAPDESEALTVYDREDFEDLVKHFEYVEEFTMPTNKQIAFVLRKPDV